MRRVVVIGTSGSGKTTMARKLARRLDVPHIELDAVHWKPGWVSTPAAEMLPIVDRLTSGAAWTCDGNYSKVRELIWSRADTIIWLDYPMSTVFTRVLRRSVMRWWRQEELWNGNRERLRDNLFCRYSLLLWVINTWRQLRREYSKLLRRQRAEGKNVVRLRTPDHAARWLERLKFNCDNQMISDSSASTAVSFSSSFS
jgi:adenylate kinase family enzyme